MASVRSALRLAAVLLAPALLAGCAGIEAPAGLSPVGEAEAGHAGFSCPPGEFVVGFDAAGAPRCEPMPAWGLPRALAELDGYATGELEPFVEYQPMITGSCTGDTFIRHVYPDGDVDCGEVWRPQGTCTGDEFALGYDANGDPVCDEPALTTSMSGGSVLLRNAGTSRTYTLPDVDGSIPLPNHRQNWREAQSFLQLAIGGCDRVARTTDALLLQCIGSSMDWIEVHGPRAQSQTLTYRVNCRVDEFPGTIHIIKRVDTTPFNMTVTGDYEECLPEGSVELGPGGSLVLVQHGIGWLVLAKYPHA